MRHIFALLIIVLLSGSASSQDFEFYKPSNEEWELKSYGQDTSVHAIVLREYGKAHISVADNLPVIFDYHVCIKILDNKGFNSGTETVSLYHSDKGNNESIRFIQGATLYKDDNGVIKKTALNSNTVQRIPVNERYDDVKLVLPNLRAGCIIEYYYQTESPFNHKFHTWNFQSDIPKLHSEYVANFPAIFEYKIALRGQLQLANKKTTTQAQAFDFLDFTADCITIDYTMNDIPAFIEEEYMTAPANYKSALYFELRSAAANDNFVQKITKEWKDADYTLKYSTYFGEQINHTALLKKHLPADILKIPDTLDKAKATYAYLQNFFKWNGFVSFTSHDDIEKAIDNHRGNSADINLTLVAALNAEGINTEAVILSTRENGNVNKLYPVLNNFNYVIAKANIGGKNYLLDATDPLLPFGLLPLRCINDQGRVMSLNKPSYWIDMVQPDKRTTATTVNLALQADGKIKGTITRYSLDYAAYEKRREIKKFPSTHEYIDSLNKKFSPLKITSFDIQDIDSLALPVTEAYEVEINADDLSTGSIFFDPVFWDHITKNPFKLAERNYPVDIGSATKNTLSVILSYPDNYTITTQPTPLDIVIPNNGGNFTSNLTVEPGILKYSQVEKLNKPIYLVNEYPYLKEFYNKIIQTQKTGITLRKKN